MRFQFALVALLFSAGTCLRCQEPLTVAQMKQMLDLSQRRGQLEMNGADPFHLVASFEWFDVAGKPLGKGTLDELWKGPDEYRRALELPGKHLILIDNGGQGWRTGEWSMLHSVSQGIESALTPFRERPEGDRLSLERASEDNPNLDCVGTEPDLQGVGADTHLALTTYCMAKGNHLLRLVSRPNAIQIAFNDIQSFGRKYVPRTIEVALKGRAMMRLHIERLEPLTDFSMLQTPAPADAQTLTLRSSDSPLVSGELMHGQLLTKISPQYPQEGMRGQVVVKLHINTKGAVESAEVLSAENQVLKAPILTAVKQWRYRVAYRAGKVVDDDQTVVFQYGRDDAQ
jgi:TonB family protein